MSERKKALDAALSQIEKQFGKGSIMKLGEEPVQRIEVISTGSLGLDMALGVGGLPRGRVIEIYGPESSGKTTLCLEAVASVQRAGGVAVFIDAEHALDVTYARRLGVDLDALLISQPDTGEQALEIADMLARSGGVDLIVIDSVAALTPRAEIEGEMGDQLPGLQARLMSQALRKLTANISRTGTTIVFINQIRMKIGVMFGNPETTTGGNALKFYASVRMDIRRTGQVKRGDDVIGSETRVKVVKNKVAPPFREAKFDIIYGAGVCLEGEVLDLATAAGLIEKSGAWYACEGQKIGQGRENAKAFLKENRGITTRLTEQVLASGGVAEAHVLAGRYVDLLESRQEALPVPQEKLDAEAARNALAVSANSEELVNDQFAGGPVWQAGPDNDERVEAEAAERASPGVVYSNPLKPDETWAGRGRRPKWLMEALESGRSLSEFASGSA